MQAGTTFCHQRGWQARSTKSAKKCTLPRTKALSDSKDQITAGATYVQEACVLLFTFSRWPYLSETSTGLVEFKSTAKPNPNNGPALFSSILLWSLPRLFHLPYLGKATATTKAMPAIYTSACSISVCPLTMVPLPVFGKVNVSS